MLTILHEEISVQKVMINLVPAGVINQGAINKSFSRSMEITNLKLDKLMQANTINMNIEIKNEGTKIKDTRKFLMYDKASCAPNLKEMSIEETKLMIEQDFFTW